jgi:hypothetical protein
MPAKPVYLASKAFSLCRKIYLRYVNLTFAEFAGLDFFARFFPWTESKKETGLARVTT